MKKVGVLGSTGSIGTQTLSVIKEQGDCQIEVLAAGSNITLLEAQIREFLPKLVCVYDEEKAGILKRNIRDLSIRVVSGMEGLLEAAVYESTHIVITAFVGMIGLRPTIAAIQAGKHIGLANKETLVTAGHLIMPLAKKHQVQILPVDSEHSAIFQCLNGENKKQVSKIMLTASGGPFRKHTLEQLKSVQLEDALCHPNWSMGKKITIDSSTMVNKGLEVMEAKWLFDLEMDQIQVVVHPQSVIHSMVEFLDGAVMAQLGVPDMRLPIQYALYYPNRLWLSGERLDFWKLKDLTFEAPDFQRFEGLCLAYEAGRNGGSMPTVFNAANEKAVEKFLNKQISYLTIVEIIKEAMMHHKRIDDPTLEDVLQTESETYEFIESRW